MLQSLSVSVVLYKSHLCIRIVLHLVDTFLSSVFYPFFLIPSTFEEATLTATTSKVRGSRTLTRFSLQNAMVLSTPLDSSQTLSNYSDSAFYEVYRRKGIVTKTIFGLPCVFGEMLLYTTTRFTVSPATSVNTNLLATIARRLTPLYSSIRYAFYLRFSSLIRFLVHLLVRHRNKVSLNGKICILAKRQKFNSLVALWYKL